MNGLFGSAPLAADPWIAALVVALVVLPVITVETAAADKGGRNSELKRTKQSALNRKGRGGVSLKGTAVITGHRPGGAGSGRERPRTIAISSQEAIP